MKQHPHRAVSFTTLILMCSALAACSVGPNYVRPTMTSVMEGTIPLEVFIRFNPGSNLCGV